MQVYDSLNKHFEKVKGGKKKATSAEGSDTGPRINVVKSSGRVQYDVDAGVEETKGGS
jgi:hypothetical protein